MKLTTDQLRQVIREELSQASKKSPVSVKAKKSKPSPEDKVTVVTLRQVKKEFPEAFEAITFDEPARLRFWLDHRGNLHCDDMYQPGSFDDMWDPADGEWVGSDLDENPFDFDPDDPQGMVPRFPPPLPKKSTARRVNIPAPTSVKSFGDLSVGKSYKLTAPVKDEYGSVPAVDETFKVTKLQLIYNGLRSIGEVEITYAVPSHRRPGRLFSFRVKASAVDKLFKPVK